MLLMSLLRLSGIVIMLISLMVTIAAGVSHGVVAGILPGAVVLLGLLMALAGDAGIARSKVARELAQKQKAEKFRETHLTVPLRWFRWLFFMALFAALTNFGLFFGIPATWHVGKYGLCAMLIGLTALMASGFAASLLFGWQVARAGYLLNLDPLGLSHAALPSIPWREVRGLDLKEVTTKGVKQWYLVVALREQFWQSIRHPLWVRAVGWLSPQVGVKDATVTIHCNWTSVSPFLLAEAAKTIADRAGAQRVKSWRYFEPIEVSAAGEVLDARFKEAQEDLRQTLFKLEQLGRSASANDVELKNVNARIHDVMSESGRTLDAKISHDRERINGFERKFRQSLHHLYVAIGLIVAMVIVQFAFVRMR